MPFFAFGPALFFGLVLAPRLALGLARLLVWDLAALLALSLSGTRVSRSRGLFFRARRRGRLERSPP